MTRTDRRRFPILIAAIAALALAMTLLFSPVQAQEGSAPDKPTGLSATATHDQVVLTWDDPGDASITGYVILRRVRVNNTGGEFSELVADTGTAATTYTDATVKANTTYTYRIKATNEHGVSERSRWFHIDTLAAPVPDKPRGLEATASHDSVTLTWDDPNDDSITGYVILRRIPGVDPEGQFSELVSNTGTDATTYTDDTVAAETRYTYRIKATNEHGVSERSRWFHINVPAAPEPEEEQAPEPPDKPTGLSATASHDQVVLTWDDPGDDTITGYVILRRVRVNNTGGEFSELVADTGTAATTYTDDSVQANTTYTYRIKATNEHGVSERSRWSHINVPAAPEAVEGDDPDGEDGGAPGHATPPGPGKRANVSEGGTDLPANTTTGQVEVGSSVTGNIGSFADRDYFRVVLEAGTRYQIDLEGAPTGRGTLADPALTLYDESEHNLLDDVNSGIGANSRGIFTPTTAGTYYLRVEDFDETDTGTYTLSVIVLGANGASEADTDLPNSRTTTGRVEAGASATGNIGTANDYDWFRVDLEAGKTYQIDLKGIGGGAGTLENPYLLDIRDSSGTAIGGTENDDVDPSNDIYDSQIVYTPTVAGTYYLVAISGTTGGTGTYTLSVRDITPPPDDSPDDSGNVPDPVTDLLSNLGQATNTNFGLLIGTFENAQGFTTGSDSHGYFLAGISLDVNAVPRTPADVTISLWSATSDSPPKPDAAVATLTHSTDTWATGVNTFNAPGGTVLDPGTTYFVVQSYSGARAHLGLRPTASGSADDDSTGWSVAGARLTRSHTDLGDWSRRSGEYTKFSVSGAAVPAQGVAEGATDLPTNVSEPDGEDLPADTTTTGEVEVGGSVTGNVDRDADVDWFAVELKKGKRYQFDVEGADTGRGNLADPFLWGLYDAGGQAISDARSNDGGVGKNGRVIYTPTADGTYYIAAAGTATMTGTYTLSVILLGANGASEADTDFPRDTTTTGRVEVGASATGNIDPGEDLDGFRVNLEAGKRYRFDLEGADTGRGSQADPILALYGDSFNVSHYIDEDDDGGEGLNSRLTYTATATGIYHLGSSGLGPRHLHAVGA